MSLRRYTRRDVVVLAGTVGVVGTVGLAGYMGEEPTGDDVEPALEQDVRPVTNGVSSTPTASSEFDTTPPSVWSMAHATAANTGYAPVAGPTVEDLRWERELPGAVLSGSVVAHGSVFVTTSKKRLYALSARNGRIRWERQFDRALPYTPACVGDMVLLSIQKTALVALSAATGDTIWTASDGGGPVTAPTVYDGTVAFAAADDRVYVLDVEDGSKRADSVPLSLGGLQTVTVEDDRFYVGATAGVYAMDGRCVRRWHRSIGDAVRGPPVLVGDHLFVAGQGGTVHALDKHTGNRVWTVELDTGGVHAPLVADGASLFVLAGPHVHCLEQETGETRWTQPLGSTSVTGIALGSDTLFLGTFDNTIRALAVADGDERWRHKTELPVRSPPALVDGRVYIGDDAGVVRAFD